MTLVLASDQPGFERYALTEGTHMLGTRSDCDVRIEHPTVSRCHARIEVDAVEARVFDLGSKNGTRIDDRVIRRSARIEAGQRLSFGTLDLRIESVESGDLELAVALDGQDLAPGGNASEVSGADAGTTAALGSLRTFVYEHLPVVLGHLDEKPGRGRVAQAVGEAFHSSLPTRRVEIVVESGEDEGVLFVADSASDAETPFRRATSGRPDRRVTCSDGAVTVRVDFLHHTQAVSYAPVVRVALRLVRLADLRAPSSSRPIDPPRPGLPEPATVSPAVRKIYDDAAKVARGDVSVLITGASGTGKEVLARYIHAASHRRQEPLVVLNCAALPRDLLEAELFGVERGVATGVEARPGRFELSDGGTLFLDEIADMAPETQATILRVLQEREVYRLGARAARSADVRIVAATNRDVDALRDAGTFRLDLYHRIADWRVELPPLTARGVDIPNLAAHFLARAAERRGLSIAGISRSAIEALDRYHWPGNIRQLEREVARAALFVGPGELLQSLHLSAEVRDAPVAVGTSLKSRMEAAERSIVEHALSRHARISDAARALEISRSTFYRRLKALGIDTPDPTTMQ